jgi:hypothetical protein
LAASAGAPVTPACVNTSTTRDPYSDDMTLPMIATPNAPPTCRVVSFIAEPMPAFARGSDPMIDSVAGAMVSPIPIAITTMRQAMSPQYEMFCEGTVANSAKPMPAMVNPLPTTNLVPMRSTSRALLGATTSMVSAIGSRRTPASSAV